MIRTRNIGEGGLYLKAIVYGHFGVGKTYLAAKAAEHPDMGPALIVNIEGGGGTASNVEGVRETEQLANFEDVYEVFWNLANNTNDETDDWSRYKTVIVDSGSALQDMNIMEVAMENASARKKATRISQQDWGDSTRMVMELLRKFKSLPKHTIVTARQRDIFATDDVAKQAALGPSIATPDFTPALRRALNHLYDHVWAMTADENGVRYLLTAPNGVYHAKTRGMEFAEAIGPVIENPDLPTLFDTFKKTQGKHG